ESEAPHRLRVCAECLRDLSRGTMPYAALANGLWIGDFPEHLKNSTFVEMAAASPVRNSGMVIALEQMKVGNIPGSAQRMMRGTFTTFFQNGHSVQDALPTLEADIAGSITCALVGARPTDAQLRRLLGARRSRILELMDFQRDRENILAGEHALFKQSRFSMENLESFPENGSVPPRIYKSLISAVDSTDSRQKASSSYVPDNLETETPVDETAGESCEGEDHNDAYLVNDSADDAAATSLGQRAAAFKAASSGRPPPAGTKNMLVVPHTGRMVEDFNEPGVMIAAYFDLFPHGLGGHLDKRARSLSFTKWARILLRRRDPRFRKDRTFVFCMAAIIFRREAISNAHWKLSGRVSRGVAKTLSGITPSDLLDVAREMEGGKSARKALADRPAARQLIDSMHSVMSGASWTMFNKRSTRMLAISMIMQLGQPLFWMTINPADKNSPIVMMLAGVQLDVNSKLKSDLPDYVKRLQSIAGDPVASADFFHITIDAVLETLLRFGAKDGDGGVLGRIKAYVGMTEEQRRLTLHCHLLVWVYGFNDFASLRD
ncbi:unnamed protein product, partial [Pylaiella littoralis]